MYQDKKKAKKRLAREKAAVKAMIVFYCKVHHAKGIVPCNDCENLINYAFLKLDKCSYIDNKPPCSKCRTHCYSNDKRNKIKAVMRYSGPRMLYAHPVLAIRYFLTKMRYRCF
ncbi:MAG: nitrous oxide-stimulated promoter family protein [Actinobacteria bacterium]|nr:nitrous oxide-stimulated promoter family protein [Actinomycetota bacterium]